MVTPIRCIFIMWPSTHLHRGGRSWWTSPTKRFSPAGGRSSRPSVQRMKWRLVVEVGGVPRMENQQSTNVRCHSVLIDRRSEQHKLHAAKYTRRTPDRCFNNRMTSVLITIKSWEHNLRSEVAALSWTIAHFWCKMMRGKVEKVDRGERTYEDVLSSLETEQLMVGR